MVIDNAPVLPSNTTFSLMTAIGNPVKLRSSALPERHLSVLFEARIENHGCPLDSPQFLRLESRGTPRPCIIFALQCTIRQRSSLILPVNFGSAQVRLVPGQGQLSTPPDSARSQTG